MREKEKENGKRELVTYGSWLLLVICITHASRKTSIWRSELALVDIIGVKGHFEKKGSNKNGRMF